MPFWQVKKRAQLRPPHDYLLQHNPAERIDLRLLSLGGEDTAKTLRKVARVVQDLGGMVIWADEKQERN